MSYVCVYRTVWLRVCVCVYCTDQDVTCIYYVEPIVMYLHYAMIKSSFGGYPRTEATTTTSSSREENASRAMLQHRTAPNGG